MPENDTSTVEYEEYVLQEPDPVSRLMRYGIVFLIISILCVLLYALLTGVFSPPAPRTLTENSLLQAEEAVKANPGAGRAWAMLASAQYASGDESEAWKTLAEGRKKVKDRSILYVNLDELQFLILENKNEDAVKKADEFLKVEAQFQIEEKAKNAEKGIVMPDVVANNTEAERLFVFKGTAQGNLGQWSEAVKTFDQVLELNDRAADIITLRGWAKLKSGDTAGARSDFERALQFLPDNPSAIQGLKEASGETTPTK